MATRIGLITTGRCEQAAIVASLTGAFADERVQFELCFNAPLDSFTSSQLSYPAPIHKSGPTLVDRLVASLAAELGRRKGPDIIIAIDDLELANLETPQLVVALVRDAVGSATRDATRKTVEDFRERCSIHFLCPMVEAYFFGDPAALVRAGATRDPILDGAQHLERFAAADLPYLAPGEQRGHPWRTADRARHPKRYLKFLNDPEDRGLQTYKETKQGKAALQSLDWRRVFEREPPGLAFAHSLFDDLADAIGVASPFLGDCHPLTQRKQKGVLRNL